MASFAGHGLGQSARLADGGGFLKQSCKRASSLAPAFPRRSAPAKTAFALTVLTPSEETAAQSQKPHPQVGSSWRLRGLPLPQMPRREAGTVLEQGSAQHPQQQPSSNPGALPESPAAVAQPSGAAMQSEYGTRPPGDAALAATGTSRPHGAASSLGLMAVALIFMPLLQLLGHAEVATFGLVAGIARLTGFGAAVAAAARWRSSSTAGTSTSSAGSSSSSSSGSSSRHGKGAERACGGRWAGAAGALGYVLPLPHQLVLQLAAAGAVLLPLALSLSAAVWSAVSGAPSGKWLKASLLYAVGLLLPSPGVGRRVQLPVLGVQALRAGLLCGAGWLMAGVELNAAVAGLAVAGSGAAQPPVAAVTRLWLWLACGVWALQALGCLEASW